MAWCLSTGTIFTLFLLLYHNLHEAQTKFYYNSQESLIAQKD
jgi:hypothetical protein